LWEIKVGALVHVERDGVLMRGKIVAVKGEKCKVELLDYGQVVVK